MSHTTVSIYNKFIFLQHTYLMASMSMNYVQYKDH
jgi:hypothetical protein